MVDETGHDEAAGDPLGRADGLYSTSSWCRSDAADFAEAFHATTGETADAFAAVGYDAALLVAEAARRMADGGGSWSALDEVLAGATLDGARGPLVVDAATASATSSLRVRRSRAGQHSVVGRRTAVPRAAGQRRHGRDPRGRRARPRARRLIPQRGCGGEPGTHVPRCASRTRPSGAPTVTAMPRPAVPQRRLAAAGVVAVLALAAVGAAHLDRPDGRSHLARPREQPVDAIDPGGRRAERDPDAGPPGVPRAGRCRSCPGEGPRSSATDRFLVAYYGTAGTGALGVLGETPPDEMQRRLRRAGRPFRQDGERIQPVYELIVTVADPQPGPGGDYSHDIAADRVRDYIDAAHRHGALVVLDVQPGRDDFLDVAKRWRWALEDPWVGLALDPEWRMGPHQVPGRVIGSVGAVEVNRVSAWLAHLVAQTRPPREGVRAAPVPDHDDPRDRAGPDRPGLALVQHVDGFGTQQEKLATYHAVARPGQFAMGFKLFYDEDVHRFTPAQVRAIRPAVGFVSFQ